MYSNLYKVQNNFLRITNLNENFSLCPTYPRVLVVPSEITDEEIKDASLFRTKNRIPSTNIH